MRAGVSPYNKLLLYGTGGLAYGHMKFSANTDFRPVGTEQYQASASKNKAGWTAGAGTEYAICRNVNVKAEYLYYNLGHETLTANPSIPFGGGSPAFQVRYRWDTSANTVNIGLNYKF